jgi:hypothetical protein
MIPKANRLIAVFCTATALLAGCATTHKSYAPDGRTAYTLNCSGLARGWDKCFSAAGDLCGAKGYDVIDRNGEAAAMGTAGGNGNAWGAHYAQTAEREMVIACKN